MQSIYANEGMGSHTANFPERRQLFYPTVQYNYLLATDIVTDIIFVGIFRL